MCTRVSGKTYHEFTVACRFDIKYGRFAVCNNRFPSPRDLGRSYARNYYYDRKLWTHENSRKGVQHFYDIEADVVNGVTTIFSVSNTPL